MQTVKTIDLHDDGAIARDMLLSNDMYFSEEGP